MVAANQKLPIQASFGKKSRVPLFIRKKTENVAWGKLIKGFVKFL